MTLKEKAESLILQFVSLSNGNYQLSKECALMVVNEHIKLLYDIDCRWHSVEENKMIATFLIEIDYLELLKKEIEIYER